jgi:hypothetical protein
VDEVSEPIGEVCDHVEEVLERVAKLGLARYASQEGDDPAEDLTESQAEPRLRRPVGNHLA